MEKMKWMMKREKEFSVLNKQTKSACRLYTKNLRKNGLRNWV